MFTNNTMTLSETNIYSLSGFVPLPRRYILAKVLSTAMGTMLIALSLFLVSIQPWIDVPADIINNVMPIMGVVLIGGCLLSIKHYFAIRHMAYSIREHDVHFSSGIVFKKVVSQPILRIQHVELTRGPIERYMSLATLQVFSAGGAAHTFQIPGLKHELATSLRHYLLNHEDIQQDV